MGLQLFITPIHPGKCRSDIYGLPTLGGNGLKNFVVYPQTSTQCKERSTLGQSRTP
ncbi:hypothetical protein LTS18_013906, partial [Coniosporium uncinatum]